MREQLTIDHLQTTILNLQKEKFKPWSLTYFGNAIAGETGELCNMIKKVARLEEGIATNNDLELTEETKLRMGKELADIIFYASCIASKLGISLEQVIRIKFHELTVRVGSKLEL